MTAHESTLAVVIVALAVACLVLALNNIALRLKGSSMSDAFKAALAALVAGFTTKLTDLQNQLDAANADKAAALAALDAEATAEVVAATPTA